MAYNKEYSKEYYIKNKDRMLEYNVQWQAENKEKMKGYLKKFRSSDNPTFVKYCETNYEKWILASAKRNANLNGLPFNLELCDVVVPEYCPYLGTKLTKLRGEGQLDTNASIDKINPKLGYIKGNVQIISRQANRMKNNASPEQLILFAQNILKRQDIFISKYND